MWSSWPGRLFATSVLGACEIGNFARAKSLSEDEFGSRHQPMREVIALGVIREAFGRNRLQLFLKLVQIFGAPHFRQIRKTKNEVSKTKLFCEQPAQVFQQGG